MADVFISHVEEDKKIALEIAHGLQAAGYTAWCYEEDSEPGVSYLKQIGEAIEGCQVVVVIISPTSMASGQVAREIEFSHDHRKPLVPILHGISHDDFQKRRVSWRVALGTASSIPVPLGGVSVILPPDCSRTTKFGVIPRGRDDLAQSEADRLLKEKTEAERKPQDRSEQLRPEHNENDRNGLRKIRRRLTVTPGRNASSKRRRITKRKSGRQQIL